jgi:hypothetical protein
MNPHMSSGRGIVRRLDDPGATAAMPDETADLRARIGDEAVDQVQRSIVLHRQPRPLASEQAAVLREAVAPVLRDLRATGETLPDIREESHHDRGEDAVCAWVEGPDRTGQGLDIWLNGSAAFQLYSLAGQLQSWKVDQLGPGSWWPRCPRHADCGLTAYIDGELAVWTCPASDQVIAPIGSLRHPDPPVAAKFDKMTRREKRRSARTRRVARGAQEGSGEQGSDQRGGPA